MSTMQLSLRLEQTKPLTVTQAVRDVLLEHWATLFQIQKRVEVVTGNWTSDSNIGARVRDLRKPAHGGYIVSTRPVPGKSYLEYHITGRIL